MVYIVVVVGRLATTHPPWWHDWHQHQKSSKLMASRSWPGGVREKAAVEEALVVPGAAAVASDGVADATAAAAAAVRAGAPDPRVASNKPASCRAAFRCFISCCSCSMGLMHPSGSRQRELHVCVLWGVG